MNTRRVIVFIVSVGFCFASTTAGAGDSTEESRGENGETSPSHEQGRFLLDGGVEGLIAQRFLHRTSFPLPFLRGRYQFNRYFAVEQVHGGQPPFVMVHSVGARGQLPRLKGWSLYASARIGIEHVLLKRELLDRPAGFKDAVAEGGLGAERLTEANVLYGVEFGVARYFSGPLEAENVLANFRFNLGYAF